MRFLKRIIRYLATRRFARKLGPKLRSLYGKSRSYTPGQIRRALRESHLYFPLPWVPYAYAMYMLEQDFRQEFGELHDYGAIREEIADLWGRPSEPSAAGEPWIGEEFFDGGFDDGSGGDFGDDGGDGGGDGF